MTPSEVEAQVQAWEATGRFLEAARLAASAGMAGKASLLFERACDFRSAADAAIVSGDAVRAVVLAILAGDATLIERAVELAVAGTADRARGAAAAARARGHGEVAGMILERVGDVREGAEAYAEAGAATLAAACYGKAGDARSAARVLEAALRANPDDEPVALALGELLVRHGKHEAAMRVLQRIGEGSALRRQAVPLLLACAEALGLSEPAQTLRQEAQRVGAAQPTVPSSDTVAQDVRVVYGRYELIRQVASTHCAQVFEARDRLTGQRVAVKQLVASSVPGGGRDAFERLVREARILERVRHPNVVPLVELLADSGAVVTAWMSGGSLADLLARAPVVPARAAEIASAVLAALGEAHGLGILHRDVKPSNILFDNAGVPRLADFGAAHVSDSSATATAGVIGTLAYMSPEQRLGLPATTASDVYSVGATLYEMLAGELPPPDAGEAAPPSQANTELDAQHDALVMAMIARDPADRPAGAWAARATVAALRWPTAPRKQAAPRKASGSSRPPGGSRFVPRTGQLVEDTWLGRLVLQVEATPPMLAVAKAAAAIVCDGLPSVLRVDAEARRVWWEVPSGTTLRDAGRRLTPQERAMVAKALEALHAHGLAHGAVDADHVLLRHGAAQLAWCPERISGANPADDLEGLSGLS